MEFVDGVNGIVLSGGHNSRVRAWLRLRRGLFVSGCGIQHRDAGQLGGIAVEGG